MTSSIDEMLIHGAFERDLSLRKRVFAAIDQTPQHAPLFEDIARYSLALWPQEVANGVKHETEEPASKKRKLENGRTPTAQPGGITGAGQGAHLVVKDVSFSIPQRKKLSLEVFGHSRDGSAPSLGARNASDTLEFMMPLQDYNHVLRLPVPEKAQKQYNFCLIPSSGLLPSSNASQSSTAEPVIWTVNAGPLKSYQILDSDLSSSLGDSDGVLERTLDHVMKPYGISVTYPEESEFASATPESHRKSEKAYHVKAFRGSKDGYLFFLSCGIFFGFKKPLLFFPFDSIDSTSYTSVLQRTFNLNIAYKNPTDTEAEAQEVEFSMIDQADFAGIDAYLKRHELQDASMADARRAKKLNLNAGRRGGRSEGDADGATGDADERTELQKAEQELEDEEDEEEEDYDPGSEGESEGSGSESEEEDGEGGGDRERDLVSEELGSEAEDVDADVEDEDQL